MSEIEQRWIWTEKENPKSRIRLYCFHHAGGSATSFQGWAQSLTEVEVKCLQMPGRWSRIAEPPFKDMNELIDTLMAEVRPLLKEPFAFFGYSLGGLIAYEFAKRLQIENAVLPKALIICSRMAPTVSSQLDSSYDLPTNEFIHSLEKRYGQLPAGLKDDPEIQELYLPSLRADMELLEKYKCENAISLRCPISAFAGSEDLGINDLGLKQWREFSEQTFHCQKLSGGHFLSPAATSQMLSVVATQLNLF